MYIGHKIEEVAEKKDIDHIRLAELIGDSKENVIIDFEQKSISIDKLLAYSEVLKHNFIQYYYSKEPLKIYRDEEFKELAEKLEKLRSDLENANNKISSQQQIIESKNELISTQKLLIETLMKKNKSLLEQKL